jgi:hypothetical protein
MVCPYFLKPKFDLKINDWITVFTTVSFVGSTVGVEGGGGSVETGSGAGTKTRRSTEEGSWTGSFVKSGAMELAKLTRRGVGVVFGLGFRVVEYVVPMVLI